MVARKRTLSSRLPQPARYSFRFVYGPLPTPGIEHCDCENSLCTAGHMSTVTGKLKRCQNAPTPGEGEGTPERPFMLYIGVVCVPCAQSMAVTGPSYVTAPYGTLDLAREYAV